MAVEPSFPMPKLLNDPVAATVARLENHPGRSLIALAGLPGSGKSTLAVQLCAGVNALLGEGTMVALSMDGFHLTRAQLDAFPDPEAAHARRGAPWTFDALGLSEHLARVKASYGETEVPWPAFHHGVGDPEPGPPVPPTARLVLVEGLYLLLDRDGWEPVRAQFDEHWFLDTPREVAQDRLVQRHRATRGYGEAEALARIARNDGKNADIVWSTRDGADALVVCE